MRTVKIDIVKAIEMRSNSATLRDIGKHFGTSAEAVRQALNRAERKKKERNKLTRLLKNTNTNNQNRHNYPVNINRIINNWTAILEAAKKGIALESEVADLKARLTNIEVMLSQQNERGYRESLDVNMLE
ncbi:hypothetical protein ACFLVJ_00545 [Chloroflexota bacterium]